MYKQNEDGTFMSVLVPNGAASSMVDYANSARAVKTPSTPQESQALAIYNSAIDDSAAADTNTPTNSSKEGTLYEELTTEKSTLSPENHGRLHFCSKHALCSSAQVFKIKNLKSQSSRNSQVVPDQPAASS